MNPLEQFEAELGRDDTYCALHDHLAQNDDEMLEQLVAMRKEKGLSQSLVAARMNRSKTAVSNFERLGADPHLSTIRRYAAAVGACITSDVRDFDEAREELFSPGVVQVVLTHYLKVRREVSVHEDIDLSCRTWSPIG